MLGKEHGRNLRLCELPSAGSFPFPLHSHYLAHDDSYFFRFAFIFLTEKIGESLTILRRLYGLNTRDLLLLLPKAVSQNFVIGEQPTPTVGEKVVSM